jgi:hypothetical protein
MAFIAPVFGGLAVVAFACMCFAFPGHGVRFFLSPGELLAPSLASLLPTSLANTLAGDEGGPSAAIGLLLFWSALFWWLVFSAAGFLLALRKRNPDNSCMDSPSK